MVEIYPREGTETRNKHNYLPPLHVEIYPREGTETLANEAITNGQTLKFIPVRGRKRDVV